MSESNLLAIWAKHERGEGATNEELGHLITRFEQAERNADTYQKLYEQRAEPLEQAEQAIARVRELSTHMRECVPDGLIRRDDTAWRIDRALDGEQNE